MKSFTVDLKEFKEAVEAVWLKGKYKSSTVSKTDVISNTLVVFVKGRIASLANASDTIAAIVNVSSSEVEEDIAFMLDIEKAMKYLKSFRGEKIKINIDESKIKMSSGANSATMPLSIEHQNMNFIVKLKTLKIVDDEKPMFGKSKLETKIIVDGKVLASAIKDCNTIGTATYRLDYDGENLRVSSANFHVTEHFVVDVPIMSSEGPESTVEFSAPIDKFCKETIVLYISDDKPILLVGMNRKLVMAPYIRVN